MTNDSSTPPGFSDVLEARRSIRPYLSETSLHRYAALDEILGCDLWVKHENHQPIGAFKVRGGIHLLSSLSLEQRSRGVITASTGNHGQSIAYAARLFGVAATIVIPQRSNPSKVSSMRALGAEIIVHGQDFDDAREEVERRADADGACYVHSANEPLLIAGVATLTLEILERVPDLDVLVVPVGGGSGAAGAGLVVKALRPQTRLIAVQAEAAPAAALSWREKRLVEAPQSTLAEGLATRTAFELTQRMLRDTLDDFVLVSDDAMLDAVRLYIETARTLVEPSGAASLAAVHQMREELRGLKVAVVLSGGNISPEQLRAALDR
jgi:threonine dehydratase